MAFQHTRYCSAKYCFNNRKTVPELVFHTYPKDEARCKEWLRRAGRLDLSSRTFAAIVKARYGLCSAHFQSDQYKSSNKKRLIQGAMPTIFLKESSVLTTKFSAATTKYESNSVDSARDESVPNVSREKNINCKLGGWRYKIAGMPTQFQTLVFDTEEDFTNWKHEAELSSHSEFVARKHREKSERGYDITYYDCCHKSRSQQQQGVPKTYNTVNIPVVGKCPAQMKVVKTTTSGNYTVTYMSEHVGHDTEIIIQGTGRDAVRSCHTLSTAIHSTSILEVVRGKLWRFSSSDGSRSYLVTLVSDACTANCSLWCWLCEACGHQYTCTCLGSRNGFSMCEHIHKICSMFPLVQETNVFEIILDCKVPMDQDGPRQN